MLVLSRKSQEAVVISGAHDSEQLLRVTVLDVRGGHVKLGFEAVADVPIHRAEVWERMRAESQRLDTKPVATRNKYRIPYLD